MLATVEDVKRRFHAFDPVPDGDVQLYLDDTAHLAGDHLGDAQARIHALWAAHSMALNGLGGGSAAGLTSWKSGAATLTFSDAQANATGLDATAYGKQLSQVIREYALPFNVFDCP